MNYERDLVISGVHIGEHSFEPAAVIKEIQERCIDLGMNFVTIRTPKEPIPAEYFYEWAKFLADNKIYFIFLYTIQHAPEGQISQLDAEIVANIKKIAGEYFIGDMIGEVGSSFCCKLPGYFIPGREQKPKQDAKNMQEARDNYIKTVANFVDYDKSIGVDDVVSVEATVLNNYNMEAGVTIPMCELMCGNPEIVISALRGTARAYNSKLWGTYIAHEWYGGLRHDDIIKQKRLQLAYRYAYMAGSKAFCLESGDEEILSYDYHYLKDHGYCQQYRDVLVETAQRIKDDARPAGGPKARVAFVQGNLDSYGVWGASAAWSQFERPEWSYGPAEHSWRIFDEIGTKRNWSDPANYGERDYSALPAYGMYDIIPAVSSYEVMSKYDYLIFVGWNTMTAEIYANLEKYVENGGKLFITAAHLSTNSARDGAYEPINGGDLSKLFGCKLTGNVISNNYGMKFAKDSLIPEIMYPGTTDKMVDPIYSCGQRRYAEAALTSGVQAAYISDTFFIDAPRDTTALVENKLGKGTAILLTTLDYPGLGSVYPLYRTIVREILEASHRTCDVKILGGDGLRFSVYDAGDGEYKVYLLNTDYDFYTQVKIETPKKKLDIELSPLELRIIEL